MKTIRIALKNLKEKLQTLNSWPLSLSNGGKTDLFQISSIFYLSIFIFNLTDQILKHQPILERLHYTLPFLVLAVLFQTRYKKTIDFFVDAAIGSIMIVQAGIGDFSGVPFIFLLLFRLKNKKELIVVIGMTFIGISGSSIVHSRTIPETFVIIALYAFMGAKYYYDIHKPVKELKLALDGAHLTITELRERLEILGTPKILTDEQILMKYPFLKYTGKDGDDPYRKIRDIRKLSEGQSNKAIGSDNGTSEMSQSRMFTKIKEQLEIELSSDEEKVEIYNNTHLIRVCIELGIIHVTIKP